MNEFPIQSQTSETDKDFIFRMKNIFGALQRPYDYVEIGSFMGGSLTPFLFDSYCLSVLSIDDRGHAIKDERGINVDYTPITSQAMRDNLTKHGVPTTKLTTYDYSIETLASVERRYDLAFIDGEHTDLACFRDFLYVLPLLKSDAIVMFHDSSLVYKALQMIRVYATRNFPSFRLVKKKDSEMSALFLGTFAAIKPEDLFGEMEDFDTFCTISEDLRALWLFKHRAESASEISLKPIRTLRAY